MCPCMCMYHPGSRLSGPNIARRCSTFVVASSKISASNSSNSMSCLSPSTKGDAAPPATQRGKSFAPTALSDTAKPKACAELTEAQKAMLGEIEAMQGPGGFDVIIICCSNLAAEEFWQERLEATVEEVTGNASTTVLAVHEDWNGGAGNGLGTLYAFQKACSKAQQSGLDLMGKLKGGAAVAIYHTAGKGTRLAPLPGAENNNKPGVKLSALVKVGGEHRPLTILEAVVRQTSSYARVRPGRCSVFWGDQVFVPSCGVQATDKAADILAALRPMPTKEEWEAEELHQYGLIAVAEDGSAMQLEKVTYDVAVRYLPADVKQVGTSLGSFSLSAAFMAALLEEFASELAAKTACLDSDPHFWMPVTLARQASCHPHTPSSPSSTSCTSTATSAASHQRRHPHHRHHRHHRHHHVHRLHLRLHLRRWLRLRRSHRRHGGRPLSSHRAWRSSRKSCSSRSSTCPPTSSSCHHHSASRPCRWRAATVLAPIGLHRSACCPRLSTCPLSPRPPPTTPLRRSAPWTSTRGSSRW